MSEQPNLRWRRKRSEPVADCRVFHVRRDICVNPRDGREHNFYVIEAPDWINVIPLTTDDEVVMIEQYRFAYRGRHDQPLPRRSRVPLAHIVAGRRVGERGVDVRQSHSLLTIR